MSIALTKKELANIAGYSYQRIHMIDQTLPANEKLFVRSEANEKKFDLALFVQRWAAYNRKDSQEESVELSEVKAKHEKVKMEKTKLEVARMRGEYVSIAELAPLWSNMAATVAERFNHLATKLAPGLVMIKDADIIEAAIEREVRDALGPLATMPVPDAGGTPDDEDEKNDDD